MKEGGAEKKEFGTLSLQQEVKSLISSLLLLEATDSTPLGVGGGVNNNREKAKQGMEPGTLPYSTTIIIITFIVAARLQTPKELSRASLNAGGEVGTCSSQSQQGSESATRPLTGTTSELRQAEQRGGRKTFLKQTSGLWREEEEEKEKEEEEEEKLWFLQAVGVQLLHPPSASPSPSSPPLILCHESFPELPGSDTRLTRSQPAAAHRPPADLQQNLRRTFHTIPGRSQHLVGDAV